MHKKLISLLLCLVLVCCCVGTAAQALVPAEETNAALNGITAYNLSKSDAQTIQQWLDDELARNAGQAGVGYILALHQSGQEYDYTAYARALIEYINGQESMTSITAQKYALALLCANCDSEFIPLALSQARDEAGIMNRVYSLHLANNGVSSSDMPLSLALERVLELQLEDGGWAVYGEVSDVDVTAMVVQALAPHYSDKAVREKIERAVALLASRQLENGGFASFGSDNAESCAQVIIALSSLNIDCTSHADFIKNSRSPLDALLSFSCENGSFSHETGGETSEFATMQAYEALTALRRLQQGSGALYLLDKQADCTPDDVRYLPYGLQDNASAQGLPMNVWICIGVAVLGVLACAVLFLLGKRDKRNFIAVAVAVLVLIAAAAFADIQPADEYYSGAVSSKSDAVGTVSITIRCDKALGIAENEFMPEDGIVLKETEYSLSQGETVYDILTQCARENGIHLDTTGSDTLAYVKAINYLYEYDCGELSGWMYRVNGQSPSAGCGSYILQDGDTIEWLYTTDIGNDLS